MSRRPFRSLFPAVSQLVAARSRSSSAAAASPSLPHVDGKAATGAAAEAADAAARAGGKVPHKAPRLRDVLRSHKFAFTGLSGISGLIFMLMVERAQLIDIMSILRGLKSPKEEEKVEGAGSNAKDLINSEAGKEEIKGGSGVLTKSSTSGIHEDNISDKKVSKGNAGISANMILKIPTGSGSHIEIVIRADMPMNQLANLSESVKAGKSTFTQEDLSIALKHAANDRISFLKNKENFALEKDKEQLKLEQAAVAKLNELIESLSASSKHESVVEHLLNSWFNQLIKLIVTSILGSAYVYVKSRAGELKLSIVDLLNLAVGAASSSVEKEFEILRLPVCPFSGMIVVLAESEPVLSITVENMTAPEVAKGPEITQAPLISDDEMLLLYKWMLEEYRLVEPENDQEKEKIDAAKALLKELIRTKSFSIRDVLMTDRK